MSPKHLVQALTLGALLSLTSCITLLSTTEGVYYQQYDVKSSDPSMKQGDNLYYEDSVCKISYAFWAEGGSMGFDFENKTTDDIYINLKHTHFISNDKAYDYYLNRTFTLQQGVRTPYVVLNASSQSTEFRGEDHIDPITGLSRIVRVVSGGSSSAYGIEYKEDSMLCIPAGTSKTISEYHINSTVYRSCDLDLSPRKLQSTSKVFDKENSPLVFSNRIRFTLKGQNRTVQNNFYVSGITNYTTRGFISFEREEICGSYTKTFTSYYKNYNENSFYITYAQTGTNH